MTNPFRVLFIAVCVLSFIVKAEDAAPKEAGKYERKSVTYINALWLMDESVRQLSGDQTRFILDKIKQGISMTRFDYNPVPESFVADFINQANALALPPAPPIMLGGAGAPDPMLDSITAILERTVVPKILEVVDLSKELRAGNLTSEQQRNSFISDKAKSLGITMEDIEKVMNSAYVFIPLIRHYHEESKDSAYSMGFDPGIIWLKISTKGEKAEAVPVLRKFTVSQGFGRYGKSYASSTGNIDYKEFAFRSAVKNGVRNLVKITQEVPDFQLSGQVLETGFLSVSFDLGKNEGVSLDDKYRIIEFIEGPGGAVSQKKNGWVIATSVGDSNSKHGYKSKARVVAGSPFIGAVLTEYPRLPVELVLKYRMFSYGNDSTRSPLFDSLQLSYAVGPGIDIQYNIGRSMGISQLFLDIGFGIGLGNASGYSRIDPNISDSIALNTLFNWDLGISLLKKFYIGRCAIMLQPIFGFQHSSILSSGADALYGDTTYFRFGNAAFGFAVNGGLEMALSPAFNLGVSAGYQFYGASKDWTVESKTGQKGSWSKFGEGVVNNGTVKNDVAVNRNGLTLQLYFTWSLPGLPFDPIDLMRASSGL